MEDVVKKVARAIFDKMLEWQEVTNPQKVREFGNGKGCHVIDFQTLSWVPVKEYRISVIANENKIEVKLRNIDNKIIFESTYDLEVADAIPELIQEETFSSYEAELLLKGFVELDKA